MKRYSATDVVLMLLLGVLALGGLSGAIPMIVRPDGSLLGMTPDLLLYSPVADYFLPGIFLLVVMALWPMVALYALFTHREWASLAVISLGIATLVWIVYETITIRTFSPLQPLIAIIGLGLILLGWRKEFH